MVKKISDDQMVRAACRLYQKEGTIEIDNDAKVSRAEGNPDKGAYVQAWVWVYDSDVKKGD